MSSGLAEIASNDSNPFHDKHLNRSSSDVSVNVYPLACPGPVHPRHLRVRNSHNEQIFGYRTVYDGCPTQNQDLGKLEALVQSMVAKESSNLSSDSETVKRGKQNVKFQKWATTCFLIAVKLVETQA
jgi:hypothetical protein